MFKKVVKTDKAPAPVGPYSQGIEVNNFVYFSGQIPLDAETGSLVLDSIEAQTEKVMSNISMVLESVGLNFEHVIKTTIFITDMENFSRVNAIYAKYFSDKPPARSCVEVSRLPKDVDVEIEVIAYRL